MTTAPPVESPSRVRRLLHNFVADALATFTLAVVLFLLMFGPK